MSFPLFFLENAQFGRKSSVRYTGKDASGFSFPSPSRPNFYLKPVSLVVSEDGATASPESKSPSDPGGWKIAKESPYAEVNLGLAPPTLQKSASFDAGLDRAGLDVPGTGAAALGRSVSMEGGMCIAHTRDVSAKQPTIKILTVSGCSKVYTFDLLPSQSQVV